MIGGISAGVINIPKGIWARSQGAFYVPSEEQRHERSFMQWPVSRRVYPDNVFLGMVQRTIADIANVISEFEPVTLLAAGVHHGRIRRMVSARVELWDVETEDLWCRDSGPIFVVSDTGNMAVLDIAFNGWGKKQVHQKDSLIAFAVAERLNLPLVKTGLVGEAGGIEQNGQGILVAHESSWVNENRNPSLSRDQIERSLLLAYGAEKMVWSAGLSGMDITDYHIDSLVRFTGPMRMLANLPEYPKEDDPFFTAARATIDLLRENGLEVEILPEPHLPRVESHDFVAAYVNYYVCNGAVVAPQFGDERTDRLAVDTLQRHFPEREIITLNVDPWGELGGGIHCATQQMPAS